MYNARPKLHEISEKTITVATSTTKILFDFIDYVSSLNVLGVYYIILVKKSRYKKTIAPDCLNGTPFI